MLKCGLLGKKLGHSYSPTIHHMLADYDYDLYEKEENEIEDFLKNGNIDGLNVTIPYKKTVIPYLEEMSDSVKRTGSVNVIVRRKDGSLYGDNTDVYGFYALVIHSGIDVNGKKTLVLGNGGAAPSVCVALESLGAIPVIISRRGEDNYNNIEKHSDAEIIVNTTPLGMYPNVGESPIDLAMFKNCKGVFDIVYNPAVTKLLRDAEILGIPNINGLYMLVAQAKRAAEVFTGTVIEDEKIRMIHKCLEKSMRNVILVGMPGSGKTTISNLLGEKMQRDVIDSDACIVQKIGMSIPEFMKQNGEKAFRDVETEVLQEIGKLSCKIISTGGGCILRDENYEALHQNGTMIWITRDIQKLPCDGRPLSNPDTLNEMYKVRKPRYEMFADVVVDNNGEIIDTINRILEVVS